METKNLKNKTDFLIFPSSPFHFDGTFHKPSHFPDKLDERESGRYWQAIRIGRRLFGLKIENKGETQRPKVKVSVFYDKNFYDKNISEGELKKIKQEIVWRFDLNADLKEFNKLTKSDKRFYPIFKKWLGMRNSSAHNLYELLIIAVLFAKCDCSANSANDKCFA